MEDLKLIKKILVLFLFNVKTDKRLLLPSALYKPIPPPDMEVESKVMKAINEVKSFDVLSGGGIGLYNADGTLVMVLVKK